MKRIIFTENAPAPIGPYNQATLAGNTLYVSGQIPVDPKTNEVVKGIEAATVQVMENLKAVLEAAGATFENVVKTTIFLADMNQFGEVNAVYGRYFDEKTAPARETVQVANLPKFVEVEISCIAVL
ncbi:MULTISPECIES: RidA family protein [Capnocytophaga]|uniref:Reactive intermediate/imine deaminase n=2 Tax=Capnocytophaga TaxID=1016 RepID=A0A250G0Y0_9FLAO|nr:MULTISPECIES: RidA family protein [Capnocytophaga]ATA90395.1 reactive intermediate/imine deaminase [Capnocytophaga stomatis]GET45779.1 reactive intermediate/imine deaminase [Capnocytophaga felis]GET48048.1 reactive intermediate/imine deaminase [Capnocytophaga felis]GIJ94154.1 reactive intermediate/imine deaminase [Capnocytophaga stomatis]GIJ97123.1 reactive intermediate/imine deaminase [Capnocytophaga stomatis]